MIIERNLLISLLKLTKDGPVSIECVNQDSKIASNIVRKLLEKLQNASLLYLNGNIVEADSDKRLRLAVEAASLGADIERVSTFLRWQEFEEIAAIVLERNGYVIAKNMRFKYAGHRWEIDVVGCRKPLVLCLDCKHWQRGVKPSALRKIVEAQTERAYALAAILPSPKLKVKCVDWTKAKFIPVILSLIPSKSKFYDTVPLVPILQLQNFLIQLPAYADSLKYFTKELNHL
jgi:Holliday junction resolvase-like predicted endonuclease